MGKKRQFRFSKQNSSAELRQGTSSASSTSFTRQDGTSKLVEPRNAEASSSSSGVNEQLQLLRESSRSRPTRAAIEEFVQASTAPSLPPEMASSLSTHNYGNEQQTSNYSRMMFRTMRCFQNGQEVVFVNRARRGQAGRWVRLSNPNESARGPGQVYFSNNQKVDFRLQHGSKMKKGFSRLSRDAGGASTLPRPGSLLDLSLRTMAQNWIFVREYETHNLNILPAHLRSKLVSYLGIYAPSGTVNLEILKLLFKMEDLDSMRMLDLTGCVSHRFSVKDVLTFLKNGGGTSTTNSNPAFEHSSDSEAVESQAPKVIEDLSWDQQFNLISHGVSLPTLTTINGLSIASPFENLTHLSLSHPSPGSRPWFHFFRMIKAPFALTRLTHLSMAYWPSPFVNSERTEPTPASGYQDDSILQPQQLLLARMAYKASLPNNGAWPGLRRLAKFTPRLEELDLEGCTDWALCLAENRRTWAESVPQIHGRYDFHQRSDVGFSMRILDETAFLMAHWDELVVVHLGQGCVPATVESNESLNESRLRAKLQIYLEERMKTLEFVDQFHTGSDVDSDEEDEDSVKIASSDIQSSYDEWQPELQYMNENEIDQWLEKEDKINRAASELIKGKKREGRFRKGILLTGTFPKNALSSNSI